MLVALAPVPAVAQGPNPTGPQPELPKERLVITTRDGTPHEFSVEMALTSDQQTVGLMFRPSVPADGGMLFDWGVPHASQMWMRNTIASLDMVFINADGTIRSIAENTVPESLAVIDSRGPVRATLELAAGTTARLDIRVGDKVQQRIFGNGDLLTAIDCAGAARTIGSPAQRLGAGRRSSGAWRSLVSAPVLGTGGRGFKSRRPDQENQGIIRSWDRWDKGASYQSATRALTLPWASPLPRLDQPDHPTGHSAAAVASAGAAVNPGGAAATRAPDPALRTLRVRCGRRNRRRRSRRCAGCMWRSLTGRSLATPPGGCTPTAARRNRSWRARYRGCVAVRQTAG